MSIFSCQMKSIGSGRLRIETNVHHFTKKIIQSIIITKPNSSTYHHQHLDSKSNSTIYNQQSNPIQCQTSWYNDTIKQFKT